ncbi:MAG: isoamylase early set domain-containing protein [Desulfatitalea sp.]
MQKRLAILCAVVGMVLGCAAYRTTGPNAELHEVVFNFEGKAKSVCITGDFNQWAHDSHCLVQRQGVWSIRLRLPHGPIHYAFVVDGKEWVMDPKALFVENDGFGKQNSVVMIE